LSWACKAGGNKEEVLRLLRAGAQINGLSSSGRRPLCQAVEISSHAGWASEAPNGHNPESAALVNLLLERGADPNLANRHRDDATKPPGPPTTTPLELALGAAHECSPQPAVVGALLRAGADPNARSAYSSEWFRGESTPLGAAAIWGDTLIMRMLIRAGARVNGRDGRGRTPLMHAARAVTIWNRSHNSDKAMRLLLRRGAHIHARDDKGWTPLFYAIAEERRDYDGQYELVGTANFDAIKTLLRHGAKINVRDNRGRTPLMWAAAYHIDSIYSTYRELILRQDALVRLLLRSGADSSLRDKNGRTARDLAQRVYNLHVLRALDKYKSRTRTP
jgi:ankyrin repeat protein